MKGSGRRGEMGEEKRRKSKERDGRKGKKERKKGQSVFIEHKKGKFNLKHILYLLQLVGGDKEVSTPGLRRRVVRASRSVSSFT